jgi:hypothetical protein
MSTSKITATGAKGKKWSPNHTDAEGPRGRTRRPRLADGNKQQTTNHFHFHLHDSQHSLSRGSGTIPQVAAGGQQRFLLLFPIHRLGFGHHLPRLDASLGGAAGRNRTQKKPKSIDLYNNDMTHRGFPRQEAGQADGRTGEQG